MSREPLCTPFSYWEMQGLEGKIGNQVEHRVGQETLRPHHNPSGMQGLKIEKIQQSKRLVLVGCSTH
jgi:hypothetical protein